MKRSTGVISKRGNCVRIANRTVLTFLVTEVFSDGQTCKSHTSASSWWLVHLTEHKGDFGFAIELDDFGLLHFVVQIIAFTRSLADTSKDGVTTVCFSNVVLGFGLMMSVYAGKREAATYDKLLDEHSLTHACTSKETNLSSTSIWCEKDDDFDTGNKDFSRCRLFNELWRIGVDGLLLCVLDGATLVNWLTSDIHDPTKCSRSNRYHDRRAGVSGCPPTHETFGTCD